MENKADSIVELPGVACYDNKTKQSFKKVRKLKGKPALPYRDGEIPVEATKTGQLESDGPIRNRKDGEFGEECPAGLNYVSWLPTPAMCGSPLICPWQPQSNFGILKCR